MGNVRIRRVKNRNYTVICNEVFKEKGLSLKAKGLYALVMSLPDDWDFSLKGICELSKENYTAVNNAIKELIDAGYCQRGRVYDNGKISGFEYYFFEEKEQSPRLDFLNMENLNDNKYTISNNPNSNTKGIKKSISNDIQKVEYSDDFLNFWALYDYPKDKKTAYSRWRHLDKESKELAVKAIPAYFEDCARNNRCKQHPATYLNKRTFEDDFTVQGKIAFYDVLPTDSEQEKKFKNWMRTSYPNIENTVLPLSYADFMSLYEEYGTEEVKNQLEAINANIGKYKYSDINAVLRANLEDL